MEKNHKKNYQLASCACGNTDSNNTEDTLSNEESSGTAESTVQTESEEEKALRETKERDEKANIYLADYFKYDTCPAIIDIEYDANGYLVMKKGIQTIHEEYYGTAKNFV